MSTQPTSVSNPEPAIIVIFGVTGDLSKRYLMPALYRLFRNKLVHEKTRIVGISRRDISLDDMFGNLQETVRNDDGECDAPIVDAMRAASRTHQLDMADPEAFKGLKTLLDSIEDEQGMCSNRLFYLSIPPSAYTQVIQNMGAGSLNQACPHGTGTARLMVEKPFGHDLASAEQLIADTAAIFQEEQVFRIDHYLAKETAQNIMTFRFENPIFEPIWNSKHIQRIDITASEKIGIEGRVDFYEQQGALRDLIQNHLLQLLGIVAMDRPETMDSEGIHDAKLRLLQSVEPITANKLDSQTVRAQYEGYKTEVGKDSFVETFASIKTHINSERWHNVPVVISTGKNLADKHTRITITFSDQGAGNNDTYPNILRFRIQPDEGIELSLLAKKPGFDQDLQPVRMDFSYAHNFSEAQPSAYERVILDAVRGDRTLFASSDEVLASWRIIDDAVHDWTASGGSLKTYQPGTPIEELSL
jgi:glucose-6-phosphate 1-dehydrogenase